MLNVVQVVACWPFQAVAIANPKIRIRIGKQDPLNKRDMSFPSGIDAG